MNNRSLQHKSSSHQDKDELEGGCICPGCGESVISAISVSMYDWLKCFLGCEKVFCAECGKEAQRNEQTGRYRCDCGE